MPLMLPIVQRWVDELKAAIADGFVSEHEVMREIEAGHVRPSLAFDVLNEEPPYPDEDFVFPDERRRLVTA